MSWIQKWLHVYGKDLAFISSRMAKLQREYTVSHIIKLTHIFGLTNIKISIQFQLFLWRVIPSFTIATNWLSQFMMFLSQALFKMPLISPTNLPTLGHLFLGKTIGESLVEKFLNIIIH